MELGLWLGCTIVVGSTCIAKCIALQLDGYIIHVISQVFQIYA